MSLLYKDAAAVVDRVISHGVGLREAFYKSKLKSTNPQKVYALVCKTVKSRKRIESALRSAGILDTLGDRSLGLVMAYDLIYGQGLRGGGKLARVLNEKAAILRKAVSDDQSSSSEDKQPAQLPRYVRVNLAEISRENAIEQLGSAGIKSKADPLIPDVITVDPWNSKALIESPLVRDFTLVLQDRGSCLSAHSLLAGVQPGEKITVVDACASPGSKTIHMLQLMRYRKIEGTMVAMELDPKRAKVLLDRLAKAGFLPRDGTRTSEEVAHLSAAHSPDISVEVRVGDFIKYSSPEVTHVNLDPSCSGSGLVDVHADSESVGAQRLRKLSSFQCRMLDHALTAFPAVQTVCYSTCSIKNEENGEVVKKALNRLQSGYRREWPFEVGSCWKEPTHGARDVQVRPEVDHCRGFYLCKLVKDASVKRRGRVTTLLVWEKYRLQVRLKVS
ncbi:williams-beuren syndrome critical region protein, putative [Perkinsus marinus ATCC 50983]|uniref:Williams-beuren syndrome critical region protein, putative n=1 Tax=Perkinsus marinus (strain ATCC 50983 / TXsc) TaxID=423536 RepID=C5L584_PERM5|nr:williams-beuren syndrome critical region protein, putative [Perkinsus marinus ATCC 50983]EER08143.1 williams-beuren syndrome critical region protein, putative [Perkinsus marinus ATCC 50983]|eukprot:XP_002776327.1 williams-beuren syndrome critical region protein, putative [Perkinsus marinus ATCC 50983]